MMPEAHPRALQLRVELHCLLRRHGATSVLYALLWTLLQSRQRPKSIATTTLCSHIRRDIGLPPAPPEATRNGELH